MATATHIIPCIDSATKRDRIRRDDRRITRASKRAWLTFASTQPV